MHDALRELTGGRGPDACIDAVGLEAHAAGPLYALDRAKQALMLETDRPLALREAIRACRNGGVVSIAGVYGGLVDHFPIGAIVNRSLIVRSGQCATLVGPAVKACSDQTRDNGRWSNMAIENINALKPKE